MKRTVTEILRRGFENMIANWPILAIRIAESIVMVIIVIGAIIAVIIPIAVSIGVNAKNFTPPSDPSDAIAIAINIILEHWGVIVYAFLVASVVLLLILVLHSFVIAGCARVFVDAERQGAAVPTPKRDQMQVFTVDRWLRGGKDAWWPVFWIYNITWGIALLLIQIVFVAVIAMIVLVRGNQAAMAITGCLGLLLAILFLIPLAVVTNIWTQKAIVNAAGWNSGVGDSLRSAWREFMDDLGRHIAVVAVMIVISFAAAMLFSSISWLGSIGGHQSPAANIILMPAQIGTSILNSVFSAAVSAWFLACFASLATEKRG